MQQSPPSHLQRKPHGLVEVPIRVRHGGPLRPPAGEAARAWGAEFKRAAQSPIKAAKLTVLSTVLPKIIIKPTKDGLKMLEQMANGKPKVKSSSPTRRPAAPPTHGDQDVHAHPQVTREPADAPPTFPNRAGPAPTGVGIDLGISRDGDAVIVAPPPQPGIHVARVPSQPRRPGRPDRGRRRSFSPEIRSHSREVPEKMPSCDQTEVPVSVRRNSMKCGNGSKLPQEGSPPYIFEDVVDAVGGEGGVDGFGAPAVNWRRPGRSAPRVPDGGT